MVFEFEERAVKALEHIAEKLDELAVLLQSDHFIDEEERGPVNNKVDLTPDQLLENLRVEKKEDHLHLEN